MWGKLPGQLEMEERQWETFRSTSAGKREQLHYVTVDRKDAVWLYQMEEQPRIWGENGGIFLIKRWSSEGYKSVCRLDPYFLLAAERQISWYSHDSLTNPAAAIRSDCSLITCGDYWSYKLKSGHWYFAQSSSHLWRSVSRKIPYVTLGEICEVST